MPPVLPGAPAPPAAFLQASHSSQSPLVKMAGEFCISAATTRPAAQWVPQCWGSLPAQGSPSSAGLCMWTSAEPFAKRDKSHPPAPLQMGSTKCEAPAQNQAAG